MKKLSRSNIMAFLISLVIVNVVFICLRPFFSFNIFSYDFIMHSLIAVSVSIFPWGIYYIVSQEYENLSIKYLLKFNTNNGEITLLCTEKGFNNVLEWNKSDSKEYIIDKPNGFTKLTKDSIFDFEYFKITKIRQILEPLFYVIKSPVSIGFVTYMKLLFVIILGALGYMYYNHIPFTNLLSAFKTIVTNIYTLFIAIYIIIATMKVSHVFFEKNNEGWTTYDKTSSFKYRNSFVVNFAIIIFLSVGLTHLF